MRVRFPEVIIEATEVAALIPRYENVRDEQTGEYKGTNFVVIELRSGNQHKVAGDIDTVDRRLAEADLERQGYDPVKGGEW